MGHHTAAVAMLEGDKPSQQEQAREYRQGRTSEAGCQFALYRGGPRIIAHRLHARASGSAGYRASVLLPRHFLRSGPFISPAAGSVLSPLLVWLGSRCLRLCRQARARSDKEES